MVDYYKRAYKLRSSIPKSLVNLISMWDAQYNGLKLAMRTKFLCVKLPTWG